MTKWQCFTVAELQKGGLLLVEDGNHGEYRPRPHEFVEGGTRFIRAADLADGEVRFAGAGGINEIALKRIRKGIGRPGDILFSHKGTVGKLARVPRDAPSFVCSPQTTFWRVLDESRLRPDYLYAFMRSRDFIDQWWVRKGETDMADYVSLTAQRQLRVIVPPPAVQRRIAEPLGALDDLIENNRRRIELLEQMAQAIYREWFVHFRYPGHEDAALVDSALGPIPEGWDVRPFSEIASFVNGFAFKPSHWGDTGRPIIKIKQLKQGVAPDTPRCHQHDVKRDFWVEPGDLLFSWSADLGVYRWSYEPGLLNQHLFTVRPSGTLSLAFLFRTLDRAMPQFRDRAQGTTMRHIKRSALSEVAAAVPHQTLVDLFTSAVEPADLEVISLRQSIGRLSALRDLLLPKLVTGQIDVSELDLDALTESLA
jgi:type I restriction enzyme S subunit